MLILKIYFIIGLMISLPEFVSDLYWYIRCKIENGLYDGIFVDYLPLIDLALSLILIIFRFAVITCLWLPIIVISEICDRVKLKTIKNN